MATDGATIVYNHSCCLACWLESEFNYLGNWWIVALALLQPHVCVFPFRITSGDKKMPLFITGSAIFFNLFNGGFNGYYLAELSSYNAEWLTSWQFVVGLLLFVLGFAINFWSDEILRNLRKPGETGYVIPHGGLFKYISAPNLFGEIIEWTGFAILAWSLPATSFAIWTFANLVPRAVAHHKFYLQEFTDYPKERKAVFPFVY